MKLINGWKQIKSFTQVVWSSPAAKAKWERVIPDVSRLVTSLEVESVVAGQRPCAWQTIARHELPAFASRCADRGLIVLPVRFVGSWEGFVHHTPEGDSHVYTIIARNVADAIKFRDAFNRGDHDGQGAALGFPPCCRSAFAARWADGFFDPIFQAAETTQGASRIRENEIDIFGAHPFSNPALRYIGVRVGFHIPCAIDCQETIDAMGDRMSLAKETDREAAVLLEALLRLPMEWDCLHGIATVTTPLFKVVTNSVPCEDRHVVRIHGDFYPDEAPAGLAFPFRGRDV